MGKRDKGTQRDVLIEAVRTSGEPVKVVAARMGVKQATAYYWMKRARAARVPEFARVLRRSEAKTGIVIAVGGVVIVRDPRTPSFATPAAMLAGAQWAVTPREL
jgi:hypothetical protein